MLGAITFNKLRRGRIAMKLKFAAILTAVVATLGTVGATATMGAVDAGKSGTTKNTGSWCC